MDGSKLEENASLAIARAQCAIHELVPVIRYCTAGMKTDEQVNNVRVRLQFALIDIEAAAYAVAAAVKQFTNCRPQTGDEAEAAGRAAYQEVTEPESDMERDRR